MIKLTKDNWREAKNIIIGKLIRMVEYIPKDLKGANKKNDFIVGYYDEIEILIEKLLEAVELEVVRSCVDEYNNHFVLNSEEIEDKIKQVFKKWRS